MQKTLDFLERHVQWIALGIGVVLILWAAYHYIVTPIATVKIGAQPVGPGDVAERTSTGPAREIKEHLNDPAPAIQTSDFAAAFNEKLQARQLDQYADAIKPWQIRGVTTDLSIENATPSNTGNFLHLTELPQLAAAVPEGTSTGLSTVSMPPPGGNGNPPPAQPVAGGANIDVDWVSAFFKIPADEMTKLFKAPVANQAAGDIPPNLYSTAVLQVELQRQRSTGVDANGQPVFPPDNQVETVPPLKMNQVEFAKYKFPADSDSPQVKTDYIQWAQANAGLIYQPAFYPVVFGTAWFKPDEANPAPATQPAQGLPGAVPNNFAPPPPPPPPAGFNPRGGRGGYDPRMGRGGRGVFGGPGFNQGFGNGGEGAIDPLNLTEDIQLWAHDETVQPGKTYRYRIVYKMKNPIFGVSNAADEKLVNQFGLVSPPSAWTKPVTVPDKTKFWLTALHKDSATGAGEADMDVFQWAAGVWKHSTQRLLPGDLVPGTDRTLVDVRGLDRSNNSAIERDRYALLTDTTGDMIQKDLAADKSAPEHKDLIDQVNAEKAGNNPQAPANAAPPPGVPRGRSRLRGGFPQAPAGR